MFVNFLRGEAYLQLGDGKSATAEFQKIIAHPGIVNGYVHGALARLDLARARALAGDLPGGRAAYRDFLALWSDADPSIPMFLQAKTEYSKLG